MAQLFASIAMLRIYWGFSVRTFPGSGPQQSYVTPPPTTIIGALSYAANIDGELHVDKNNIYSSATKFVEHYWPFYVAASFPDLRIPPIRSTQLIKYFSAPYRAFMDVSEVAKRLSLSELRSPVPLGYALAPTQFMAIIFVSSKPLEKHILWSITRLGSKESMVSVHNVCVSKLDVEPYEEGQLVENVNTYILLDLIKGNEIFSSLASTYIIENMPYPLKKDEWLGHYAITNHKLAPQRTIVIPFDRVNVRTSKRVIVAEVGCNNDDNEENKQTFKILIPDEIFGEKL